MNHGMCFQIFEFLSREWAIITTKVFLRNMKSRMMLQAPLVVRFKIAELALKLFFFAGMNCSLMTVEIVLALVGFSTSITLKYSAWFRIIEMYVLDMSFYLRIGFGRVSA